jgi:hypothetical protein
MTMPSRSLSRWTRSLAVLVVMPIIAIAADLAEIGRESETKFTEAEKSQAKIDAIVEGAQERLINYRALLKQARGLATYNQQLSTQIAGQQDLILRFDKSVSQVALIERQMSPLVSEMVGALAKFVELDLPFHNSERLERIAFIQDSLAAAEVDVAEKFRQVIEAYQIENEFGRKIDSYQAIIPLEGQQREVDILRVGRLVMVCQTKDTTLSARWNEANESWDLLDNVTYRNAIRGGIKMAKKQASIDILTLPITAPEAVK